MSLLGIISGTILLKDISEGLEEVTVETPFGAARVMRGGKVAYIARHGTDPGCPILPHTINHPANLCALKQLGVRDVVAANSTGSLKKNLKPGMLAVPGDFIALEATPTACQGKAVHITPALSEKMRTELLESARDIGAPVEDGGVYWQTSGPRLETKAEIAMMSQFADLVGMTMAGEAIVAQELGLEYAAICSIDNYAHGLVEGQPLSIEDILAHARRNAKTMSSIITRLIERRRG